MSSAFRGSDDADPSCSDASDDYQDGVRLEIPDSPSETDEAPAQSSWSHRPELSMDSMSLFSERISRPTLGTPRQLSLTERSDDGLIRKRSSRKYNDNEYPFYTTRTFEQHPLLVERRRSLQAPDNNINYWQPAFQDGEQEYDDDDDDDHGSGCTRAGGTLRRRQFHDAGRFLRYRYPPKFHQFDKRSLAWPSSFVGGYFVPSSLRTATRYGQEPRVQSTAEHRRSGLPKTGKKKRPRKAEKECQCSPPVRRSVGVQVGTSDRVERCVGTEHRTYEQAAVQTRVLTRNQMVETAARLVELPQIDLLAATLDKNVRIE